MSPNLIGLYLVCTVSYHKIERVYSMGNPGVQPPGSTLEPLGSTLELPGSTLELLSSWLELLGGKVKMTSVKCSNFFLSQNSRMLLGVAF